MPLKIEIAGFGFMGKTHLGVYSDNPDAELVAISMIQCNSPNLAVRTGTPGRYFLNCIKNRKGPAIVTAIRWTVGA